MAIIKPMSLLLCLNGCCRTESGAIMGLFIREKGRGKATCDRPRKYAPEDEAAPLPRSDPAPEIAVRTAILAVFYGTAEDLAAVRAMERTLAEAFPGREVRCAFLSEILIKKLQRQGTVMDSLPQALERLAAGGFTRAAVQPVWVTGRLSEVPIPEGMNVIFGRPLLSEKADCVMLAEALKSWYPKREPGETLVLMGHSASPVFYSELERLLCGKIASLRESAPLEMPGNKVCLAPLLLTAGCHVRRDMAGRWKEALETAGYTVRCDLRGLLQCEEIRQLFARQCRDLMECHFETP